MTRQEQLHYCKRCLNRKFDFKKGVICSFTDDIARFDVRCNDFLVDELVVLPEPQKVTKPEKKKKKKKIPKKKKPEKITINDLFLIAGMSFSTIFFYRFMLRLSLGSFGNISTLVYMLVILIAITIAILLRSAQTKSTRFGGNIKFKVIFTLVFSILHTLYVYLLSLSYLRIGNMFFWSLLFVFLISLLSFALYKPLYLLNEKIRNS